MPTSAAASAACQTQLHLFRPPAGQSSASRLAALRPTPVFDSYWRLAHERQRILFKRVRAEPGPWTEDPILLAYRFTNAYRAVDRVSQYLIRHVIYDGRSSSPRELFFRVVLFKLFNKIETWQLLERNLGRLSCEEFSIERYSEVLARARAGGRPIYSAAYIMPPARQFGRAKKHEGHLELLRHMLGERLPERLAESATMEEAFELLCGYPMMGRFLAFQYLIDLNYSPMLNFLEMDFVVAGPGALRGIQRCFGSTGGRSPEELIRLVTEAQETEFERLGLPFRDLWGRRLQLIDCQNLFCEVDKYARVAHPESAADGKRKRIKQKFRPNPAPLEVWFPPKWGINQHLTGDEATREGV